MAKYDPKYIDEEEKGTIESLRNLNPKILSKPTVKEQAAVRKAAKTFIRNEAKMNIRIASEELERIKVQAAKEGLRYQSLVKSVLHKYITGQLVERKKVAG